MLAECSLQQLRGVDDQRVDVGLLGFERLLAGERQQMLGEIRAPRGSFVDHPRDRRKLRVALDGVGQDFDRPGDDREDIVEIVRDAAGELADGLHLLGLPDAILGGDLVGEIAHEAVEHEAVAAFQLGHAQFDLEFLAVAPHRIDFEAAAEDGAFSAAQEPLQAGRVVVAVDVGDDQFVEFGSDRFSACPAEDLLGLRIPVRDRTLLIHLDEGVERVVDDAARQLLAFSQGLLRPPALGHVAADEEELLHRFGPDPEPGQPHLASVVVEAARVRDRRSLPAPQRAHLLTRVLEMIGMDELDPAVTDHLLAPIAQYGFAAWADLNHASPRIHHYDQILRGLENAAKLLALLPEGLLGAASFGNVADESVEQKAVAGLERGDAQLRGKYRSVPPFDLDFASRLSVLLLPGKQETFQCRPERPWRVSCAHQLEQVLSQGLLARPPEKTFGLRIPVPDDAALIDLDEGVDCTIDDATRQLFTLAQCLLCLKAFGDVAGNLRYADGCARGRLDRRDAERDLDRAAVLAQSRRFIALDAFAPADTAQRILHLGQPAARNRRSRSAWWSRAAIVRRCSLTSRSRAKVFAFTSPIACANARASTPVSPPASTGITGFLLPAA